MVKRVLTLDRDNRLWLRVAGHCNLPSLDLERLLSVNNIPSTSVRKYGAACATYALVAEKACATSGSKSSIRAARQLPTPILLSKQWFKPPTSVGKSGLQSVPYLSIVYSFLKAEPQGRSF